MTPRWHDTDAAARYVAGTLQADERDAFEEHLLSCDDCRHEVRLGAGVRAAGPVAVPPAWPVRRRARVLAPLLAAAGVVLVLGVNAMRSDGLGRVEAIPFVAGAARATSDPVAALVDGGMAAYAARDYSRAAQLLERASAGDPSAGVQFYRGVSLLMLRRDDAAVTVLLRALEPAGNPFADDARYYAMKGLVRMRLRDSAVALARAALAGTEPVPRFQIFADSLKSP
jgi:hypothetical protein